MSPVLIAEWSLEILFPIVSLNLSGKMIQIGFSQKANRIAFWDNVTDLFLLVDLQSEVLGMSSSNFECQIKEHSLKAGLLGSDRWRELL